ncbi:MULTISPECIES: Hpt domain-containing protein [Rhizobium/Agrobacterium group]|jgi:HPt (histidine-containing phosphotransfer) domain-containing protein|uniref:Hpt domain-containing protein n=1 Tax=Rhizobium/Agrobacterium group TaxID=227290 RepID=UPI000713EB56|nr:MULTISPECIES: Hpt domain-containing protein [Rhizobium/Agrobacterium group]KQQ46828.1 transcriptional regulator [Rhizobium sp. Leaf311]
MAALSIAFEAPDNYGSAAPASSKPIDFTHLARQTMGDKELEIEILKLFTRNARTLLHDLAAADDAGMKGIAHRLKGSADAVGAFNVSAAAEAVENGSRDSAALAKVATTVIEAENFILKLCR